MKQVIVEKLADNVYYKRQHKLYVTSEICIHLDQIVEKFVSSLKMYLPRQ